MPGTRLWPCASFSPSSVSAIALGWPGRLMIRLLARTTATWRERMAVGTKRRLIWRICSPKPGSSLSATAKVASGVTSRSAGPVPPVVSTRWHPASTSSRRVWLISACSSAIRRGTKVRGLRMARVSHACRAGRPLSSYTPLLARSLMETMPIWMPSKPVGAGAVGCSSIVGLLLVGRGRAQAVAQQLEQVAVGAAFFRRCFVFRSCLRFILAGLANQTAQSLNICARKVL